MMKDSDLKKWDYPKHTQVKHELLEKYLGGWLPILGKYHRRLVIFDGFAGRGEYKDSSDGSPVILLRKADDLITANRVAEVTCVFVERDPDNFTNLEAVLNRIKPIYPSVKVVGPFNDSFENAAKDVINGVNGRLAPSFWFIDPFGFSILFDLVEQIMSLQRSEVFVTLMLRDMGRFLGRAGLEGTYDRLFGTNEWRNILSSKKSGDAKEHELRDLYVSQLRAIGCKVTVFRVCMDDRRQTLYYMVHATKHPRGRWLMKDVMYKQGVNGLFAYLGPDDQAMRAQSSLFPADDIPGLKTELLNKFPGRTLTFDGLLEERCDDNELREPDYRQALKQLRDEQKITIVPVTSKTTKGLRGKDKIIFP